MLQCWEFEADKRPTFSELVEKLSVSLESMANYMDMQSGPAKPQSTGDSAMQEGTGLETQEPDQKQENTAVVDLSESEVKVTIEDNKSNGGTNETSV